MGKLKEYLRRRQLNRHSYQGKTALCPLKEMHTAIVLLGVEHTDNLLKFRDELYQWFFGNGIRARFFYMDFRKVTKNM
nr:hypothetical protein [Bacteroidales bacterium]